MPVSQRKSNWLLTDLNNPQGLTEINEMPLEHSKKRVCSVYNASLCRPTECQQKGHISYPFNGFIRVSHACNNLSNTIASNLKAFLHNLLSILQSHPVSKSYSNVLLQLMWVLFNHFICTDLLISCLITKIRTGKEKTNTVLFP